MIIQLIILVVATPAISLSPIRDNFGTYNRAAVAADSAICSTVGKLAMQELGGNAVDAAVATALCQGVVHPQSSGIGGGGFLVVYDRSSQSAEAINFREKAPSGAFEDMLLHLDERPALSVGVPGELKGLEAMWKKYGHAQWEKLFELAAEVADGFTVGEILAVAINRVKQTLDNDPRFSALKEMLAPNGVYLKEGDTMRRPLLAQTLRAIGASGNTDIFYKSTWAETMVKEINDVGGAFTNDDFASYNVLSGSALEGKFMGMGVHGVRPPCSGVVHQLMLNILSGYAMRPDDFGLIAYQRMIETFKFAYGQRNKLGDPVYEPEVNDLVSVMMNETTADIMRSKIKDDATFPPEYYEGNYTLPQTKGTTHFSIVDPAGNAVALTTTIDTNFGSMIRSPTLGFIYNNEMKDFSTPDTSDIWGLPPDPQNFVVPGKQPQSSTSPTVLTSDSGDVAMVVGASGGSRITTAVGLAVAKFYIFQKSLLEAIDPPRPHHQLIPNTIFVERDFPSDYVEGLRRIGHTVSEWTSFAVVQGIVRDSVSGQLNAVCDIRKGGKPDGF